MVLLSPGALPNAAASFEERRGSATAGPPKFFFNSFWTQIHWRFVENAVATCREK